MWIVFLEMCFVMLKSRFVFGRNINVPRAPKMKYAIAVAVANGLLIINDARIHL